MATLTPKRPAPPPPIGDTNLLKTYFDRVDSNKNGFISPEELKEALTNGIEDFPFQLATVKAMMQAFNLNNSKEIDFEHFVHLWRYVMDWQRCFRQFDADKSGSINSEELMKAFNSFGFNIPLKLTELIIKRFDRMGNNEILFDDFIRSCLILLVRQKT